MEKIISQKSFNPFTKAVKALHGELSATPERIVKEMFNKLDRIDWKNPDLKILDPAAGFGTFLREAYIRLKEFHSEEYILNNMLYACEISGFNALFMEKKMGLRNIYKGDFLTMRLPDGWPKEFDYVLCNPPYSNGMDLKFLGKAIEICKGEIVFVHPASSYIHKNKKYSKINDQVSSYLKDLVFFNGNPIFDILLFIPCAITHLSKLHNENSFSFDDRINSVNKILRKEDLSKISSFGLNESYNSLYSKIERAVEVSGSLHDFCIITPRGSKNHTLRNPNSFFVEFTRIRGNVNKSENIKSLFKDDFFTIMGRDKAPKSNSNPQFNIWAEFSTEEEASNFIKYCKTDFARMCLALNKTSQSLDCGPLKLIPLLDFRQEWTDEKLYPYFNITREDQDFIKEIIAPYYD
jgi:hypothetical protein